MARFGIDWRALASIGRVWQVVAGGALRNKLAEKWGCGCKWLILMEMRNFCSNKLPRKRPQSTSGASPARPPKVPQKSPGGVVKSAKGKPGAVGFDPLGDPAVGAWQEMRRLKPPLRWPRWLGLSEPRSSPML